MNTPGYMVFWFEQKPECEYFKPSEMMDALARMVELRKNTNIEFVGMVSQDPNSVGKPGVDSIIDGRTPDGHPYEWSKKHRAGSMRKR